MRLVDDLLVCLRFFSRLPLPRSDAGHGPGRLAAAIPMVPVAGAIIGAVPALALLGATAAGLPPLVAASLAIAALVAATGALHEDGLADCADGFGGGRSRERKLDILRDSRIGTFGAAALTISLLLRVGALEAIAPARGALVLICAALLSRTLCLLPLVLLPSARADGLGAAHARPAPEKLAVAGGVALALMLAESLVDPALARFVAALALALIGVLGVCGVAWRQIGGQTGDVAGAAQQIAEIAILLTFAAAPG